MAKRDKKLRKESSVLLGTLLAMNDGKCNWCGRSLVHLKALPPQNVVATDGDWVLFVADNILYRRMVATVDHINPIERGGTSDIDNIVPACRPCNGHRQRNIYRGVLSYSKTCPGAGKGCGQQLKANKSHCRRCWRILVGTELPEMPSEIIYLGKKFRLFA